MYICNQRASTLFPCVTVHTRSHQSHRVYWKIIGRWNHPHSTYSTAIPLYGYTAICSLEHQKNHLRTAPQIEKMFSSSSRSEGWFSAATWLNTRPSGMLTCISWRKHAALFPRSLRISVFAPALSRMAVASNLPVKMPEMLDWPKENMYLFIINREGNRLLCVCILYSTPPKKRFTV